MPEGDLDLEGVEVDERVELRLGVEACVPVRLWVKLCVWERVDVPLGDRLSDGV